MKLTIISENTKQDNSNLNIEHGLSLLIEKEDKKVLFDTGGPNGTAIQNAKLLGLELSQLDAVVISHGHNDHTGGLFEFLKLNDKTPVYLKKEALNPHYTGSGPNIKYIGVDNRIARYYKERLKFVDKTSEILKDFFIVPHIFKKFPIPSTNTILYKKEGNNLLKDNFDHELFMAVKNNHEITIFSGCGHSGINNIVNTAKEIFPDDKIKNIVGGFHFQAGKKPSFTAKSEEIETTSRWLQTEGVTKVYTGHCTGIFAYEVMQTILKGGIELFYAGKEIII